MTAEQPAPAEGQRIRRASAAAIDAAGQLLRDGALVAFPTETVYGLGGDATQDDAVARIFAAKDRPRFNPLIVHVADAAAARGLAAFDRRADDLATRFWPGALTLVLPRRADSGLSRLVTAGLDSVAVRVPDHAVGRALLAAADRPVAAPSANRSGAVSPTTAAHVAEGLPPPAAGGPAMILDGGACTVGVESTVLDLTDAAATLLRPGGISLEALAAAIGDIAVADAAAADGAPRSPGRLERHYAPRTPLRMDAEAAREGEALLGFGPTAPAGASNLSPSGDPAEAAANLFALLHALDSGRHRGIAVMPVPEVGLGRAVNDRLRRAARGRA